MSRYAAFISYSHADSGVARWLHRALEAYRLPRKLVGTASTFGPVAHRLPPIFRDRDELPASGDLGAELHAALADSRFQIVLCSPRAAASKWVNEEILAFKRVHGESRTLALIVSGEPYAGDESECFPAALRFRLGPDGALSDQPAEPIAADIRKGKDGRRLALLKLVAGIAGVPLDALVRRDQARRQQRLVYLAAGSLAIAVLTGGLAIYAERQRRFAEKQRTLAERSLEFLVGTFAIANPATENPRTITALTILERASKRAGNEFSDEPSVSARLLRTTGEIYGNLGLDKEAQQNLNNALMHERTASKERTLILLELARIKARHGDGRGARDAVERAAHSYDGTSREAPELDARIMEMRGLAHYVLGNYAQAAKLLASAVVHFSGLEGDHQRDIGRSLMDLGQAQIQLGDHQAATVTFERALKVYAAKFGKENYSTADALRNLALADFEGGRLVNAETHLTRAVAIYDRVLEPDHPVKADALLLLGRIQGVERNLVGAIAAFDRARSIYSRLYGPTNPAVGDVDFYAAEALGEAGHTEEALLRAADVKAIYDLAYGPDDPDQAELLFLQARILASGKRFEAARRDCAAGLALQIRLDPSNPAIAATRKACSEMGSAAR
jgi:tetratricopeptide (TPR) repeat protein